MKKYLIALFTVFMLFLPAFLVGQTEGNMLVDRYDSLLILDDWMVDPILFQEHSSQDAKVEAWMLGEDDFQENIELKEWMLKGVDEEDEAQVALRFWMLKGLDKGAKR